LRSIANTLPLLAIILILRFRQIYFADTLWWYFAAASSATLAPSYQLIPVATISISSISPYASFRDYAFVTYCTSRFHNFISFTMLYHGSILLLLTGILFRRHCRHCFPHASYHQRHDLAGRALY
jgi:hypothetical protein